VIAALRYEIVRLRTLRSTWWLLGAALLAIGLISFGVSYAARSTDLGSDGLAWAMTGGGSFAPLPLTAVFAGLVGVFSLGHEYRYGTIRALLTAVPRRIPVLAAKVLVSVGWAVILAVVTAALGWLVAVLTAGDRMSRYDLGDGKIAQVLVGYVLLTIMWSLVGLAFAGLFRSLPAAIVLLLLIPLVIESILAAILFLVPALDDIQWLTKYLPFSAGQQMVATDKPLGGPEVFDPLPGGITFAVFTAALLALCTASFVRRDA
jgi:ABC-2 type transport system permease protein